MSRPGYTKIEQGQREPNLEKLIRIAEALEVTTDYLLGFDRGKDVVISEAYKLDGIIKREITVVDDLEVEVIVRRKKSPTPRQEN